MQIQRRTPSQWQPKDPLNQYEGMALGLISTGSFPAIVATADMMLKTSGVKLIGYEKIGSGHCTAVVRGGIADVRLAITEGIQMAEQSGHYISSSIIARPLPNLEVVLPIGSRLGEWLEQKNPSRNSNQAIGLLETIGFPAMVGAVDAMLKSADVQFTAYEMIGAGLCTAIVRGSVANVAVAVEAGMYEAERIGELHAVMVIPRPLEDLEQTLPVAKCDLVQPQPLQLPLNLKETVKEVVELPEMVEISIQAPLENQ
ncbi:BMC domain-containing protein [Merismopedia glauca]|uniref:Microcompartment protein n=1 Tax=Merismopedia glauca CCAP 1448/3 TaxID=1296344 RepID=A0A2T1C759_9CYAN|nr:microcompartment protein [Merismopedia glauca CCAP 1448/3]